MRTGTRLSAVGHGVLIVLAIFGLPWFGPRERPPIRVTEVSFVTEAEFAAAQASAPAEAPRAEAAPPLMPAPRPAAAAPEPAAPDPVAEAEPQPEEAVAALEPPATEAPPEPPARITPKIVTLDPPKAATPPREQPAPRVEPEPVPAPPEAIRPAETPKPAPAPDPKVAERVDETPAAPPEAGPEPAAEAVPVAPQALRTSGRPKPRRGNVAPPKTPQPDKQAEAVLAALQQNATPPSATPATKPARTQPTAPAAATSLPVGPPMTGAEKEGLKLAVQRCWNVPAGVRDASELKVTVGAELAADGTVITASIHLVEPKPVPDGRFQQAYEAGRRALIRCSPYSDLPRDKFAEWRTIEVVFNPEGMVSW